MFVCVRHPVSRRYDYHLAFHTRAARDRIVATVTEGWRAQTREAVASSASAAAVTDAEASSPAALECVTIEDPDLQKYVFDDSLGAKQLKASLRTRYALERQSCMNAIMSPLPPLDATASISQHNFDFLQLSSPTASESGLAARASVSASASESKQTRRQQQLRKYLNEAGDRNEVYFSDEILKVNDQGLRQVRPAWKWRYLFPAFVLHRMNRRIHLCQFDPHAIGLIIFLCSARVRSFNRPDPCNLL